MATTCSNFLGKKPNSGASVTFELPQTSFPLHLATAYIYAGYIANNGCLKLAAACEGFEFLRFFAIVRRAPGVRINWPMMSERGNLSGT